MRTVFAILVAGAAFAQTAPPAFDVASVKPGLGRVVDFRILPGGRLHITGLTVNVILRRRALCFRGLGQQEGRPVIDRTGIEGEFDFKVDYAIGDDPDSGTPLIMAIQEQLGLKLEAAKGPVEALVVDRAEKPSVN